MKKTVKKVWNFIDGVLITVVILLAVALVGVRLVGLEPYVVLSGSMEPTYHTGSVIYVKETEASQLRVGDAITFSLGEDTVATHRIVGVETQNGQTAYRTKGDANDVEDGASVLASQVLGKPVFSIPYLGYLASYIQGEAGKYVLLSVGAFLLLMIILPDMILGEDDEKPEEAEAER